MFNDRGTYFLVRPNIVAAYPFKRGWMVFFLWARSCPGKKIRICVTGFLWNKYAAHVIRYGEETTHKRPLSRGGGGKQARRGYFIFIVAKLLGPERRCSCLLGTWTTLGIFSFVSAPPSVQYIHEDGKWSETRLRSRDTLLSDICPSLNPPSPLSNQRLVLSIKTRTFFRTLFSSVNLQACYYAICWFLVWFIWRSNSVPAIKLRC